MNQLHILIYIKTEGSWKYTEEKESIKYEIVYTNTIFTLKWELHGRFVK